MLEQGADTGEDRALDLFLFGRRLDDEIAIAEGFERLRRGDALERGLPLLFGDALAAYLPRHVAVDGCNPGLDPVGGQVVELDVETGERADMRDAATHLTRPDNADLANMKRHVAGTGLRPLFDLDHVLPPFLRRSWPRHHGSVVARAAMVNGRACRVPPPIPAAPGKDRQRVHSRRPGRSAPLRPC